MQKDFQLILSLEGRFTCGRSLKLNVKLVLQLGITDSLLALDFPASEAWQTSLYS